MFEQLHNRWLALQSWWQELTPDSQAGIRGAGIILGAVLAAWVLRRVAARKLRAVHFDNLLRLPWAPPLARGQGEGGPSTPSHLLSILLQWSVWAAAVWWLATDNGWLGLAHALEQFASRVWSLVVVLVLALYLARVVAEQLIAVLQSPPLRDQLEVWWPRSDAKDPRPPQSSSWRGPWFTASWPCW